MAENIIAYTVRINTENGKVAIDGLTKGFVQAETAAKKLITTTNQLNTGLDKNINKSGLAGAAVTELGRTISDSNYGIQGMANNLSQLGTLMTTLISTTGGVVNGFKAMWGALMGPLGIIIVVQTLLAVWEGYDKRQREATKAMYEADSAAAKAASNLRVLRDVIDDENLALDEKQRAIAKANEEYKDLNLQLDENGKLTEASVAAIDSKIAAMAREAKARAILQQIEKKYAEQAEAEATSAAEFVSTWDLAKSGMLNALGMSAKAVSGLAQAGIDNQKTAIQGFEDSVKQLQEQLKKENLVDELFKGSTAKGRKLRERVFKQIFLDLTKTEEKYRKDSLKADLLTEEEKIERGKENALRELEITHNTYIEKRKLKLKEFLESNATEQSKLDAQKKFDEEAIVAAQQVANVKVQIEAATETEYKLLARKRADLAKEEAEKIVEIERQIQRTRTQRNQDDIRGEIDLQEKLVEAAKEGTLLRAEAELKLAQLKEELRVREYSDNAERGEFVNEQLRTATDFMDSEFQRQLDIEQNKTTALNNELRNRLNNEELSKEERKAIQNKIAANDEALRIKQEKIEKKRFYAQKAANIAMAIVDTYVAANKVLAQQPGGVISKTAAMVAVIAAGLLNVATIARQQFKSSANSASGGGAGGGGGGGGVVNAPDFNIVGASQSRQLADVVEGQLNRPIKTYVVSNDVSTAQSLERNIVEGASI